VKKIGGTYTTDEMTEAAARYVKKDLVLKQRGGEDYGFAKGQRVVLYREGMFGIEVPRAYGRKEFGPSEVDETVQVPIQPFAFTKGLREDQPPLIDGFLGRVRAGKSTDAYGGIFNAPCGTGKTVMAIKMLSELGQAAIVLVHTGALMKQWQDELLKFTDLRPEQIGRVQQDECDWRGKSVVVAMIESLSRRDYEPDMYRAFGVAVFDEVHRHAAATWHKVISMFPARVRIGLSATPRRSDGLWKVIVQHIGNVLASGEVGGCAKVFRVMTGVNIPVNRYIWGDQTYLGALLKVLTKVPARNEMIVNEVVKALNAGRRVLVLSDRLAHLDEIERLYKAHIPQEERMAAEMSGDASLLGIGRYVGGTSDVDLESARKCKLLLGTFQYAKEGLDDPGLDTLMLTVPKGDVEQPIGRILRQVEGKKAPIVIDFVDDKTPLCSDFAEKRLRQYSRLGYEVTEIAKSR
jgi:superfamily II DNA or RNA helicase